MRLKLWHWLLVLAILCAFVIVLALHRARDPEGLIAVEMAFPADSPHKSRIDTCVKAAREKRYFTAVSGLQWLRTNPRLTEEQLTALQDAIGKIQSHLASAAQNGDAASVRHLDALQNETDLKEKP
jgi:hypothetical protein